MSETTPELHIQVYVDVIWIHAPFLVHKHHEASYCIQILMIGTIIKALHILFSDDRICL